LTFVARPYQLKGQQSRISNQISDGAILKVEGCPSYLSHSRPPLP
jgi:hypothetical protein